MKEGLNINDKIYHKMGKNFNTGMAVDCNMKLVLKDKDGQIKDVRNIHNTVTAAGKAGLADQVLGSPSLAKVGWMELGTGTPGATLLGAYISGSRTAASKSRNTNVITLESTFAAGVGTGAITEAGTFDVVTQNTANMWMSASFAVINKAASDSLTISWTLTIN